MDAFIGTIMIFGGNFAPRDWAFCDGKILPITNYTALFSILGDTYGGDGRSTFALPKLDSPVAGTHYIICLNGVYPSRS